MSWSSIKLPSFLQSAILKNSAWGITANVLQTAFVSLFFVILARQYSSEDFAHFLIASTVYQILVAFSAMGLGQWFIREFDITMDKPGFTGKFIKIQTGLGLLFYFFNIMIAFILYPIGEIWWLSIVLGTNIIFDNIIYSIKNLNIAEFQQKKTFTVLTLDGFLRLVLGCVLFVYPLSIITLSILLIALRFLTVNLFIKVGSSNSMNFKDVLVAKVVWEDLKTQILINWRFAVIGSVSIIYWRLANVFIAKNLSLQDVADYEISFKIFSILMILPIMASSTIYSRFVKNFNSGDIYRQKALYQQLFIIYTLFALFSYGFIYSFDDLILPYAFGDKYIGAIDCLKEMFLTILISPTVLLQANLIVAMKAERTDMILNIISLIVNVAGCLIGLYFFKSLSVINYSIFGSFLIFHILQNIFLIKKGITSTKYCVFFYFIVAIFILSYNYLSKEFNSYIVFTFLCLILVGLLIKFFNTYKKNSVVFNNPLTPNL